MRVRRSLRLVSEARAVRRVDTRKASGEPNLCLADFIAPKESGITDYIGAFAVSIVGIEKHIKAFEANHDDYNKIRYVIIIVTNIL